MTPSGKHLIATVHNENHAADARLIAAAPDLLEALTNLLNWGRTFGPGPREPNSPHELLVAAHFAYFKATGHEIA